MTALPFTTPFILRENAAFREFWEENRKMGLNASASWYDLAKKP